MATKSFLKDVHVRNKTFGNNLVNALENAKDKPRITVTLSKPLHKIQKDQIKLLFGE